MTDLEVTDREPTSSPETTVRFSRAKTLAFSAVAVILAWAVLEAAGWIAWRTVVPDRYSQEADIASAIGMANLSRAVVPDNDLFWRNRPNSAAPHGGKARLVGFIANSQGMRNEEVCLERGPDEFRVLCLGDSITFGWGVEYEEAYPTVLKGLLIKRLPGKRVYVLNAGCTGYTAYQGSVLLRQRGLKHQPDIVTIWFMWNDCASWGRRTDEETAGLFRFRGVLAHSSVFRLMSYLVRRRASKYDPATGQKRAKVARMPRADYEARLREMVTLAREGEPGAASHRRAHVVFICGAFVDQHRHAMGHGGRFDMNDHQQAMLAVADDLSVPVVRLSEELRRVELGADVFLDAGHIDPRGMRVVAQALMRTFADNGMLPAGR